MGNRKLIVGVNDLATVRPDVVALLLDPEDGYRYMAGSGAYVWFKCPACSAPIYRQIEDMCRRSLVCPECGYGSKNHW